MSQGTRAPQGQVADRAQMVLELTGHAALDGPMPGIMDPRRHLIGDQSALDHEELDGEHADVVKRVHYALQISSGAALELGIAEWRDAVVQMPPPCVFAERG